MPISVICPSCHARFSVSDKFAGQSGPCPKCKAPIRIPDKSEEVVIHAPEGFGPTNAEGKAVLRPIERTQTRFSQLGAVAVLACAIVVVAVAYLVGRSLVPQDPKIPSPTSLLVVLGFGAVLLAPPLVASGYSFLRDAELEPYRGSALALRVGICSLVYALLWGAYAVLTHFWIGAGPVELWQLTFLVPLLVVGGATASFASLDLEFTNAALHYGLYLGVTIVLRLIMGMAAL